jgi:hypothetical protein
LALGLDWDLGLEMEREYYLKELEQHSTAPEMVEMPRSMEEAEAWPRPVHRI